MLRRERERERDAKTTTTTSIVYHSEFVYSCKIMSIYFHHVNNICFLLAPPLKDACYQPSCRVTLSLRSFTSENFFL